MKGISFIFLFLYSFGNYLFAQRANFTTSGTIIFEKSVNTYAILQKMIGGQTNNLQQQILDQYKKSHPQFEIIKSKLEFNNAQILFTPEKTSVENFGNIPTIEKSNVVYTDLSANKSVIQKTLPDGIYLIKDSLRKIKWKITDEVTEIAGYTCRRANGLIMDSVYVVAFFTNEIPFPGGPESFTGLPGMILEVALPHDNIIWRATMISQVIVPSTSIIPPKEGEIIDAKQLYNLLDKFLKPKGAKQYGLLMKIYSL